MPHIQGMKQKKARLTDGETLLSFYEELAAIKR